MLFALFLIGGTYVWGPSAAVLWLLPFAANGEVTRLWSSCKRNRTI